MGEGYEKYLQVKIPYTNSRKVTFYIEGFGRFCFSFVNLVINKVLCDFGDFLSRDRYDDMDDYRSALVIINALNVLVYNATESDDVRKYIFEIGPLPPQSMLGSFYNVKNVFCVWDHNSGEDYYYNPTTGTQNFVYDYGFIDSLSTPPSGSINLQFNTVDSDDNLVFKMYTAADGSSFAPYSTITIQYDEA
jgi:hypothetical protein